MYILHVDGFKGLTQAVSSKLIDYYAQNDLVLLDQLLVPLPSCLDKSGQRVVAWRQAKAVKTDQSALVGASPTVLHLYQIRSESGCITTISRLMFTRNNS